MSNSGFLGSGIGPTAIKRRSGLAAPVPVAGSELIVNGDFASAAGWQLGPGWSISSGIATHTGGAGSIYRDAGTFGAWHSMTFDLLSISGGALQGRIGDSFSPQNTTPGAKKMFTARNTRVASILGLTAGVTECTADNVSCKLLTLASLLSTRIYASANCDLSAAITRTAGTQAGFVARLDSASSPANFLIAYLDGGGNVKVDKCVAGVYTNVISGAVTYGAGKILRLVCSGNSVSAYYDGTQVGSTVTVSDAGIVSNTRHGLFSTYASNSFVGYVAA